MSLKVDLHCHTTESDGSLSYRALLERAAGQGVDMLAITDHDTTSDKFIGCVQTVRLKNTESENK